MKIFDGVGGFRRLVVGVPSSLLLQSFSKIAKTNASIQKVYCLGTLNYSNRLDHSREFHTNSNY
jgi:hypothetical protein